MALNGCPVLSQCVAAAGLLPQAALRRALVAFAVVRRAAGLRAGLRARLALTLTPKRASTGASVDSAAARTWPSTALARVCAPAVRSSLGATSPPPTGRAPLRTP